VTPDTRANAHLQHWSLKDASIFHFVNFRRPHLLDFVMQGLWIKTQTSPFERRTSAACRTAGRRAGDAVFGVAEVEPQDADPAPAAAAAGRLPAPGHGQVARAGDVELDVRLQLQTIRT